MNFPQCLKEIELSGRCAVDENGVPDHERDLEDDSCNVPEEMEAMNGKNCDGPHE
jgi:hypothetical protein